MKKANLACAPLPVACVFCKFGGINLTRLRAKFDENLKFESKFCGADGFLKPNLNLLKFDPLFGGARLACGVNFAG